MSGVGPSFEGFSRFMGRELKLLEDIIARGDVGHNYSAGVEGLPKKAIIHNVPPGGLTGDAPVFLSEWGMQYYRKLRKLRDDLLFRKQWRQKRASDFVWHHGYKDETIGDEITYNTLGTDVVLCSGWTFHYHWRDKTDLLIVKDQDKLMASVALFHLDNKFTADEFDLACFEVLLGLRETYCPWHPIHRSCLESRKMAAQEAAGGR